MKRARNKKKSALPKNIPAYNEPQIDYEVAQDDFTPDEPDMADAFAVPDEVLAESLVERSYTVSDMEADDFAVSEEAFEEAVAESEPSVYDDIPDEEIPFSTNDFNMDEVENDEIAEEEPEIYVQKKITPLPSKKSKGNTAKTVLCVILSFVLVGLAVLGLDFSLSPSTSEEYFITPVDTASGKINILLLGVDKDGARSDSIMLVSYDFETHATNLISIPRDTKMWVSDRATTRKITEVHAMHDSKGNMYGAAAVARAVTGLTGMPINYYLEFSFDAVDNVMDILGPVTFDVPDLDGGGRGMNYDDSSQDLHIHLKPGVQELSGNQIQQFLRYRKSNYSSSNADGSDTKRMERQQELLKAIIDQKFDASFIIKAPDIFKEMQSQLKTNFTLKDIMNYAGYLRNVSSENINTYVLPGESMLDGAWYHICDFEETADLVNTAFGYEVTAEELTNEINLTGKAVSSKQDNKDKNTTSKKDEDKESSKSDNDDDDEKPASSKNEDAEEKPSSGSSAGSSDSKDDDNNTNSSSSTAGNNEPNDDNDSSNDDDDSSSSGTDSSETTESRPTPSEDEDDDVISLD